MQVIDDDETDGVCASCGYTKRLYADRLCRLCIFERAEVKLNAREYNYQAQLVPGGGWVYGNTIEIGRMK